LTQGYLDQRSAEEPILECVVGEDGLSRTHRRAGCKRALESRFGEVVVIRRGYGGRGLESVFPLDAALNLPPDKYSHGLREMLAEEVIGGSFDATVGHLARAGGGQVAKRQAEELALKLSQDFDACYDQPLTPLPDGEGQLQLLVKSRRWQGHRDAPRWPERGHPQGLGATGAAAAHAPQPRGEEQPQAYGHRGLGLRGLALPAHPGAHLGA